MRQMSHHQWHLMVWIGKRGPGPGPVPWSLPPDLAIVGLPPQQMWPKLQTVTLAGSGWWMPCGRASFNHCGERTVRRSGRPALPSDLWRQGLVPARVLRLPSGDRGWPRSRLPAPAKLQAGSFRGQTAWGAWPACLERRHFPAAPEGVTPVGKSVPAGRSGASAGW